MANIKITELPNLAGADAAEGDVFVIDDINVTTSKKITIANVKAAVGTTGLTASRALETNGSGDIVVSAITSTELNHLDGVSSGIQTQLDAKIATTASASNDFVTFTRLNANVNVVQDNVAALPDSAANDFITYTRLNANINVVQDNVASITTRSDAFGTYANTNLDTKANVSATYFLALANDFVTYTRLNANIDVVQDNVSALPDSAANDFITYTRLNANIDVVQDNVAVIPSSFSNAHYITTTANSYNIGVTVASINEVDVYVGGAYQSKKEYVLANSSHNVQFRDATFVAGEDIEIISRT